MKRVSSFASVVIPLFGFGNPAYGLSVREFMNTRTARRLAFSLLLLSAFHAEAATDKVPVTLRAISMTPEAFASLLPSGLSTNTLDAVTMRRLESAIAQGKAKKVEQVQKSVACGQEEQISSHVKEINEEEGMFQVGFMGNLSLARMENQAGYSVKAQLMWREPGSVEGPTQRRGEKLMRREKMLETAVIIQPGASTLLGVLPACPTDGNRNELLIILTVGGAPAAKAVGGGPSIGRSCAVELFALPAGTKDQPDAAALQLMRSNPKAKVAEMRLQGVVDTPCAGQAVKELFYFTAPGETESRQVGFRLAATPGTNESEIVLRYTTLVSPYTSADYKRAASDKGRKNAKPDEFFEKYAPHIVEACFKAKVPNTGTPVVVPLTIETDKTVAREAERNDTVTRMQTAERNDTVIMQTQTTEQRTSAITGSGKNKANDAAQAPVFFALVSSVAW